MPDRTLQAVVNKIFPWMKIKEEEEERDFYARRGIELKPEYATQEVKTYTSRGSGKVNVSTVVSDMCFGGVLFVAQTKPQSLMRMNYFH